MVRYLSHILAYGLVQGGQENGTQIIESPNGKGLSKRKILHRRLTRMGKKDKKTKKNPHNSMCYVVEGTPVEVRHFHMVDK